MKLYAPGYYTSFSCSAGSCTHSCCIGWQIDIDSHTLEKYSALTHPYGEEIRRSIVFEDTAHFRLGEQERCPHLDSDGLCRIILALGDEMLCSICREHPRFYNRTPTRAEAGLGMACRDAAHLVLTRDDYAEFYPIGEIEYEACAGAFDPLPLRASLFELLSDRTLAYGDRLGAIHRSFGVSPHVLGDGQWRKVMQELEYLDEAHRELFSSYSSLTPVPRELEAPLERALAYFIYRHCTGAQNPEDFRIRLGFCLFCERLLACSAAAQGIISARGLAVLASAISEEIEYSEDNTERIMLEFEI